MDVSVFMDDDNRRVPGWVSADTTWSVTSVIVWGWFWTGHLFKKFCQFLQNHDFVTQNLKIAPATQRRFPNEHHRRLHMIVCCEVQIFGGFEHFETIET